MSATHPLVVEHPNPDLTWLSTLREEVLEPDRDGNRGSDFHHQVLPPSSGELARAWLP